MRSEESNKLKKTDKLSIFDRDGTILRGDLQNSVYYAWQKLCEEYQLNNQSEISDKELYDFRSKDISQICKNILSKRFKNAEHTEISDRFIEITTNIVRQIELERKIPEIKNNYTKLLADKELMIGDFWMSDNAIENLNSKNLAHSYLSDDEKKEYISSCRSKDFNKAGELSFKEQKLGLEKLITNYEQELKTVAVYEPYSVPFSFTPHILPAMQKLKDSGYFVTLATTGGYRGGNGNFFDDYEATQFEKALGQKPAEFFDYQVQGNREEMFKDTMDKFSISKARTVAIADDVLSISKASKKLGIGTIAVNYHRDIEGSDKKDYKNMIFCDDISGLVNAINAKISGRGINA